MTIDNEELDEAALFNEAVNDEPVETPETPAAEPEQPEAPETEATDTPEVVAETSDDKPEGDDKPGRVPAFRLREEAETRRRLENDLAQERADKALLRQRLEALEKPATKAEPTKPEKPDPLLDPDGYEKYLEQKWEERQLNATRETSLQNAHKTYKAEFEEAYASAQKQVDPALRARMQQSRDPGETLIQWHREQKTRAEVGTDLAAYKQRLRDEALKDPEFRKSAMEAWRNEAPAQTNGRPNIQLAPSMSSASRSNASLRSENTNQSDQELWNEIAG